MRGRPLTRIALVAPLLILSLLLSPIGCGGGGQTELPPSGTAIRLSPKGPLPNNTTVTMGAQGSATPGADGQVSLRPSSLATATAFVTENGTDTPLLLAVFPKGASAQTRNALEISPRTTITGLMFLQSGAWLLPQDKHQQFFDLIKNDPKVTAAATAFETAYQADGYAFSKLTTDTALSTAVQSALDSVITDLANSNLVPDMESALGIVPSSKAASKTRDWNVSGISTVTLTVNGNDRILANNGTDLLRYVEVDRLDGSMASSLLLPEQTVAPALFPNQPFTDNPLYATVTGGLKGFHSPADLDAKHLLPIGSTALLHVVIPYVSCIVGVKLTLNDNLMTKGFPTGDPLFDELFKILVFDKGNLAEAPNKPAGKLTLQLAGIFASHQHLTLGQYFSIFKDWLLDDVGQAILADLPDLTKALVDEAATVGEKVTSEAAKKALAVLGGPEVKAALITYQVLSTFIDTHLYSFLLADTDATDLLTITGIGDANVNIRSITPSELPPAISARFSSGSAGTGNRNLH